MLSGGVSYFRAGNRWPIGGYIYTHHIPMTFPWYPTRLTIFVGKTTILNPRFRREATQTQQRRPVFAARPGLGTAACQAAWRFGEFWSVAEEWCISMDDIWGKSPVDGRWRWISLGKSSLRGKPPVNGDEYRWENHRKSSMDDGNLWCFSGWKLKIAKDHHF